MQLKKTHDVAMAIIERIYGAKPSFSYFIGGSQGGREGLMVAQRYPDDYDGILSDVPIVNFSTLMLAPELLRIREKPIANWVTPAKINTIRAEFLRQCDTLDGLPDGIINNYIEARAIFNVNDGIGPEDPWASLKAPGGIDLEPDDNSVSAKLTDGQIGTLEFTYSSYIFPAPLANGVASFGMWLPTITPDDFGTITGSRFKGQEGADTNVRIHTSLGTLGVTGFLMQDINANPLDFDEKALFDRRIEISDWLDATDPDLSDFYRKGGKIIMTIGTMDMIASSGAQLDYYQSLIDEMGRKTIDKFARMYVVPQAGHGLSGRSYSTNGIGEAVEVRNIPAPDQQDKINMLIAWVENKHAPAKTLVVGKDGRVGVDNAIPGFLLCSYPNYPRYKGGPSELASSWISAVPSLSVIGLK
jgi:pimeloyl-ACP methyl ester carboxylesterase